MSRKEIGTIVPAALIVIGLILNIMSLNNQVDKLQITSDKLVGIVERQNSINQAFLDEIIYLQRKSK